MACCLTIPCDYLNQCWLNISEVVWHSFKGNFTGSAEDIYLWYEFENYYLRLQPYRLGTNELNNTCTFSFSSGARAQRRRSECCGSFGDTPAGQGCPPITALQEQGRNSWIFKFKSFIDIIKYDTGYINGLVRERHNFVANALELRLSCTKPSLWWCHDLEILSTLLPLCEGNPLVTDAFPP